MIVVHPKRLEPYVEKMVWQGNGTDKPYVVYPDIISCNGISKRRERDVWLRESEWDRILNSDSRSESLRFFKPC